MALPTPTSPFFPRVNEARRPDWLNMPKAVVRPIFMAPTTEGPAPEINQAEMAAQALRQAQARAEAEGRARGEAEGRAGFEQAKARLESLLQELEDAGERLVLGLEDRIIDLALALASVILERELPGDRELLLNLVRQAVAMIGGGDHIEIRLAPADLAARGEQISAAGQQAGAERLTLKPDPNIAQGCIVESRLARVDATLTARLRNIAEQLHNVERS